MKQLLSFIFIFSALKGAAQLEKGSWMIGGNGNIRSYTSESTSPGSSITSVFKNFELRINPSAGYFIIPKGVVGLQAGVDWIRRRNVTAGGPTRTSAVGYSIGPYVRYYLLNAEKPFNLVTEAIYSYGILTREADEHTHYLSAMAGPVFFISKNIAVEMLLGYEQKKEHTSASFGRKWTYETKGFSSKFGLQIYLGRNEE